MAIEYRILQDRLAQFKRWENTPEDWEAYWKTAPIEYVLKNAKTEKSIEGLDEFHIIQKFLPPYLPIIEAGCGICRVLAPFAARGYPIEGVDYSEPTIQKIREIAPELNVKVGDIYHLDAENSKYGGYISLGLLEHNPEGPLAGLKEARRVIHPNGFAFISVPYLNAKREKLFTEAKKGNHSCLTSDSQFYQYYFSVPEFASFLEMAGFQLLEVYPLQMYWGLVYDQPLFGWLYKKNFFHRRVHRAFRRWCQQAPLPWRMYWAHMLLYVCRPV